MSTTIDTTISPPTERELLEGQITNLQKRILELQSEQHIQNQRAAREIRYETLRASVEREATELLRYTNVSVPAAHTALDDAITEVFRSSSAGFSQLATSVKVNNAASAVVVAKVAQLRCETNLGKLRQRLEDETRVRNATKIDLGA